MAKRGRKSLAASEVATLAHIMVQERQRAPDDLSDEECEVWFSVVNRMPADWFPDETLPLLKQFCRHAIQAKRIAELVERATCDPALDVRDYDRLLKMQERESRAISSLATKMRLSQQTTYDKSRKKEITSSRKPWEG